MKKTKINCEKCNETLYHPNIKDYFKILNRKSEVKKEEKNIFILANALVPLPFYCKNVIFFLPFTKQWEKI